MGHKESRHTLHHRGHHRMMRRMARRRRFGGPPAGSVRARMMFEFLQENPECAEKLARYGAARMREDGFTDEEIREHLEHLHDHGLSGEIDGLLS